MIVLKHKQEVSSFTSTCKLNNKKVGFVATMGALHQGHLSLIQFAKKENDAVVCSIFINPLQFNDKNDFDKYPKTLSADLALLEGQGCDVVFVPDVEEMYASEDATQFDFGKLDKVMEGVFRPGHFLGMAKVVKRLFDCVQPHTAYFGEKDFQQLAIIRKFTADLHLPVKIIGVPIMREKDGLAMSSRNTLLSADERIAASAIYKTLLETKQMAFKFPVETVKEFVLTNINRIPGFALEYFEIADADELQPTNSWNTLNPLMGFIVVRVGTVRLIDNIQLSK
ncbi:MAG: pantoate--beta-alanine ligase [Bacteroidetes bacterium]|nr:pantoate--beta-alanine ligase [Bacteroidota bacterium]MBK9800179.1 pantoate--beta-alanine ligase [Bacteroidota bacterium]MBP6412407.1 pantoate--beta-alanine ligase [Bacteroidia bacterium]